MNWKQIRSYLEGKIFLVGVSFIDKYGDCTDQFQTHGTVDELTNEGFFKIKRMDNSIFQMPYDQDSIQKAENIVYRETDTGEIISQPDFIMTWEIITAEGDNFEQIKTLGISHLNRMRSGLIGN